MCKGVPVGPVCKGVPVGPVCTVCMGVCASCWGVWICVVCSLQHGIPQLKFWTVLLVSPTGTCRGRERGCGSRPVSGQADEGHSSEVASTPRSS